MWFIKTSRQYMEHLSTWEFIKKLPRAIIRFYYYKLSDSITTNQFKNENYIRFISDTTPRTLRKWSELNPDDGFSSARGQAPGQTAGQQALYTPYLLRNGVWAGSWGANDNSPPLGNDDFLRIAKLQTADSYSVADKDRKSVV